MEIAFIIIFFMSAIFLAVNDVSIIKFFPSPAGELMLTPTVEKYSDIGTHLYISSFYSPIFDFYEISHPVNTFI